MKQIGWFTTARGPGSMNLFTTMLHSLDGGEINARLSFVFINRAVKGNQNRAKLIAMAEERNIPVVVYPSDTFMPELKEKDIDAWREEYGKGLRERIEPHPFDFGVLAGYMLIIDKETCRRYPIINLHPALPGTYTGTWEEIVGKVVENEDERYGAMVHICTSQLDRGTVIAYDSFPLDQIRAQVNSEEELVKAVRAEEVKREAPLLMWTIKAIVDGELVLRQGEVFDRFGEKMAGPLCLADRIDRQLRGS
jgi:phosphoribosylglycinamide formyltransferase-1